MGARGPGLSLVTGLVALGCLPASAVAGQTFSFSDAASLSTAITNSNNSPGPPGHPNAIEPSVTGALTVTPSSSLPAITQPVIIDGHAGPVTIDDSSAGAQGVGLTLAPGSAGSQVEGFNVTGAGSAGILLEDKDISVGNAWPNVISGNPGDGIVVSGAGATGEVIENNFIGTDSNGLGGVQTPNGGDGIRFTGGASGSAIQGGAISAGPSSAAIDAGGASNFVSQVALAGGPADVITGGQSLDIGPGTPQPSAGGGSVAFAVANGPANDNVGADLYSASCSRTSAKLTFVASGSANTNATGSGQGTIFYSGAFPAMPVYLGHDSAGVNNLPDPCGAAAPPPPPPPMSSGICNAPAATAAAPFAATGSNPGIRFVVAAFHDLLGRAPSPTALSTFYGLLEAGVTRTQIASTLENSPEYNADLVSAVFMRYLGRAPSASELATFAAGLGTGSPVEALRALILASPEYLTRVGGTNENFVDSVFCDVLGRSPGASEAEQSLTAVDGGTPRGALAQELLSSNEYRGDLVAGWYLSYLRRASSSVDRQFFVNDLDAGETDQAVIATIIGSDEYANMFNTVPIPPATVTTSGVITVTLPQPATVDMEVFQLPAGGSRTHSTLARGAAAAARAAATATKPAKLKLIGTVHFGRHRKGRLRLHWNRKIGRHKLRRGSYELVLLLHHGKKLLVSSDPITFRQR